MPSVDFVAIGSNLSSKCRQISGIVSAYSEPPNEITLTPAVVVFPPNATLTEHPGLNEFDVRYPVRLYIERTSDFADPVTQITPFIARFYEAFESGRLLGLPGVVTGSYIVTHEIDHLPDYGGSYVGARFEVAVQAMATSDRNA